MVNYYSNKDWKFAREKIFKDDGEEHMIFLNAINKVLRDCPFVKPLLYLQAFEKIETVCDYMYAVESPAEVEFLIAWYLYSPNYGYEIHPQFTVNPDSRYPYRVDFYINNMGKYMENHETMKVIELAVEIDGYEYHSTKEQKAHDAKRDRFLLENGFTTMRFTGSEIYNDAKSCVEQVIRFFERSE